MNTSTKQSRNRIPDIKPIDSNGTWVLRFAVKGEKQYLSLGKGKSAYAHGLALSERIKSDIALGRFEGIGEYKPETGKIAPKTNVKEGNKDYSPMSILERFIALGTLKKGNREAYQSLLNLLKRHKGELETALSATTPLQRNRYIKLLKTAYKTLKISLPENFPEVTKIQKGTQESKDILEEIFTPKEQSKVLEFFSKSLEYGHYFPFVKFRFLTGCRPSEAIALQWDDVDFEGGRITIKRSYTVRDGLQGRKNGEVTYLPLNPSLRALLEAQKGLHDFLVFPSPNGTYLHIGNFNRRAWKSCKEVTGVSKKFYNIRHTVLSNLVLTQGMATAAYVGGHKDLEMVTKHYGKLLSVPVLPEF